MRLSIIKGDAGYKSKDECRRYRVFLDGVERLDCQIADEERGYIRTLTLHRNPLTRQILRRQQDLFGKVEIKVKS